MSDATCQWADDGGDWIPGKPLTEEVDAIRAHVARIKNAERTS